ncbi:MAG TPA: hypothetical protein VFR97_15025 [Capillimicrobium sp.]|nr:hypothetical protein [Capillimicrobium sp.]
MAAGRVAPELAAELPGLSLHVERVAVAGSVVGRAPRELRERLAELSDGVRGAQAVALRREPVPAAYRVLFRHLGLDPDEHRVPIEAAMLDRLMRGGFRSRSLLDDALLVALVETGVGVWALAGERLRGELELRAEAPGGRVVVGDDAGTIAAAFAWPGAERLPSKATREVVLYAIGAAGVPEVFVEEALWTAGELLAG